MPARRSMRVPSTTSRPVAKAALRRSFIGLALEPLEGRPGEEQALLARLREPHERLRLVAGAGELEDHALAEAGVAHVLADDPSVGVVVATRPGASPLPPAADLLHELGRDLVEEARGRVVLRRPEDGPAPRRAEVQAL